VRYIQIDVHFSYDLFNTGLKRRAQAFIEAIHATAICESSRYDVLAVSAIRKDHFTRFVLKMTNSTSIYSNVVKSGYWLSAHDLLGMARLRGSNLQSLDVSALLPPMPSHHPRQPFTPTRLSNEDISSNGPTMTTGFLQVMDLN
jgi:hypothetical protein